jgi:hypothetical protein
MHDAIGLDPGKHIGWHIAHINIVPLYIDLFISPQTICMMQLVRIQGNTLVGLGLVAYAALVM